MLASFALGACMKIYPDPELPDIKVDWFGDCSECEGDVAMSLIGVDSPAFRADLTVPWTDTLATFVDVARERYWLEAKLHTTSGEMRSSYAMDLDLRNGLDQSASLFFGPPDNMRVAWTFDMAATCASLGAHFVRIELSSAGSLGGYALLAPCEISMVTASVFEGPLTVVARALSGERTVAVSPPSPQVVISSDSFTDVGTLVMSPL